MSTQGSVAVAQPAAGHNAIEAAVFSVTLHTPPSPEAVARIRTALNEFAEELPGEQGPQPPGIYFSMGNNMPPFGDVLRFVSKPDGTHRWRVQLTANQLQVACFDYSRFADVWQRALGYLRPMLTAAGVESLVAEVSHQYVDKFLYPVGMTVDQYNLDELFQPGTPYLTPQVRESGLLWHVFQGWFEKDTGRDRVLHQINISNTELGAQHYGCIIDHRCVKQAALALMPTATAMADNAEATNCLLDTVMRELHSHHMHVVGRLLSREKQKQIGMGV